MKKEKYVAEEETEEEILEERDDEKAITRYVEVHGPVKKEVQCCFPTMKRN